MTHCQKCRIIVIAALLFLAVTTSPCLSTEEIVIATGEYPPWISQSLKHGGYVSHIVSEAFKREGYTAKFRYYPWARAYETAKKGGDIYVSSFWFNLEERATHFYYSDPVMVEKTVFFHLKSLQVKNWTTLADLKNYTIGVTRGYTYTKEFWNMGNEKHLTFETVCSDEINFRKLLGGRIDLYPTGMVAGFGILHDKFDPALKDLITFHKKPLVEGPGSVLFSKNNKKSKKMVGIVNI